MSGNIYENVSYGLENKSQEDVIKACKKAKIHDLIMSWPNQYETILFERGAQLSGWQKQRLLIARLILKNPEVLILDEATSALDNIIKTTFLFYLLNLTITSFLFIKLFHLQNN